MENNYCDSENGPKKSDSRETPLSCKFITPYCRRTSKELQFEILIGEFMDYTGSYFRVCPCKSDKDREIIGTAEEKLQLAVRVYADFLDSEDSSEW